MFLSIQEHPSWWSDSSSPHPVDALYILLVLFILSLKLMMDFFVLGWVCGLSTGATKGHGVSRGIGRLPSGREMPGWCHPWAGSLVRPSWVMWDGAVSGGRAPHHCELTAPSTLGLCSNQREILTETCWKKPTSWQNNVAALCCNNKYDQVFPGQGVCQGLGQWLQPVTRLSCLDIPTSWLEMRPLQWKEDNISLNYELLCDGFVVFFQFSYL